MPPLRASSWLPAVCAELASSVTMQLMGKGYAEGPAAEEAERRLAEIAAGPPGVAPPERTAVYGSTAEEPERHFLGWLDDVDPDVLFAAGEAYGITVVRRAADTANG